MTNYTYHLNWKIIFSQRRLYGIWQTRKKGRKKGASSLYFCSFYASLLITLTPFALPQPASQKGPKPLVTGLPGPGCYTCRNKNPIQNLLKHPHCLFSLKTQSCMNLCFSFQWVRSVSYYRVKSMGILGKNSLLIVLIYNLTTQEELKKVQISFVPC